MEGFSLTAFLNDPAGLAVKGALIAAFLVFAFGVFAAFRDGTFALDSLAAFVRKHLLGRVLPVSLLAITAYVTGDAAMAAAAIGALGAYTVETLASIYGSVRPPAPSVVAESKPAETVNPVPQD
jgi:hypothetical protein